jgi:hypothetical protein
MVLTGETEELGEEPVPVPLCPPQIPHGLTRARTRASAVTKWGYFYSEDLYCDIVLAKSELYYHVLTFINDFDQCNLYTIIIIGSTALRGYWPSLEVSAS